MAKKIGGLAVRNHIDELCEPIAKHIEKALLSNNFRLVRSKQTKDRFYFTVSIDHEKYYLVNYPKKNDNVYIDAIPLKDGICEGKLEVSWEHYPLVKETISYLVLKKKIQCLLRSKNAE